MAIRKNAKTTELEINEIEVKEETNVPRRKDEYLFFEVIDIWNDPKDFPSDVEENSTRYSVEVMVYSPAEKSHFKGYYDHKENIWRFVGQFRPMAGWKWRNYNDKTDRF